MNILVSACLLGCNCKYDGKNNYNQSVVDLSEKHRLIPVCPEVEGGMKVPRKPVEIVNAEIMNIDLENFTKIFKKGAEIALIRARDNKCQIAILKSNSPSCGYGYVYDGTFSGHLIKGNGITADLLSESGIKIYNEQEIEKIKSIN